MGHAERAAAAAAVAAAEQEEDPRGGWTLVTPRVYFDDGSPWVTRAVSYDARAKGARNGCCIVNTQWDTVGDFSREGRSSKRWRTRGSIHAILLIANDRKRIVKIDCVSSFCALRAASLNLRSLEWTSPGGREAADDPPFAGDLTSRWNRGGGTAGSS